MTKDEALKLALVAFGEIDWSNNSQWQSDRAKVAITAIKEALAESEQEPVAYIRVSKTGHVMACAKTGDFYSLPHKTLLYTTPPQRTWVGLTDEEIKRLGDLDLDSNYFGLWYDFAKAIEAKLKEKNT
jgi:hypothetical protein